VTRHRSWIVGTVIFVVGAGLASAVLAARDRSQSLPVPTERILYLHSAPLAQRLFLSFDALAADLYWMRTIQHYGSDRRSTRPADRFALLEPLLDLTTTLDPHFNIAYRFGAILLAMEEPDGPNRPDLALALLSKGLAHNPTRWQYAHDIAFIHYWYRRDYQAASEWFSHAAAMPGAPSWLAPLAAVTLVQGGDRAGARRMLEELERSEEEYVRRAGVRGLAQLRALDQIESLQTIVDQFHAATGRYPDGWPDLIRTDRLQAVPTDGAGTPFIYRADRHAVTLSPESPLAPLPAPFVAK